MNFILSVWYPIYGFLIFIVPVLIFGAYFFWRWHRAELEKERFRVEKEALQSLQEENQKRQRESAAQFKVLAESILEEKSAKFEKTSVDKLSILINPLKEDIKNFRKKAENMYENEAKERASLKGIINTLNQAHLRLSEQAENLTTALRGNSEVRGNWGEVVLETILEASGLREGHEYQLQRQITGEEGQRGRPDVLVKLPQERCVVIDSKVSLVDWEQVCDSQKSEQERQAALDRHVRSVKGHIKELSGKKYQELVGSQTLDTVLMFVPIEAAHLAALQADEELTRYAWEQRIALVSPNTLIAALRLVKEIWQVESRNANIENITRKVRQMLDKFTGFVEDLEKVGVALDKAHETHQQALKKLRSGRGNLIGRAKTIAGLGVAPGRPLPESISANEEEEEPS